MTDYLRIASGVAVERWTAPVIEGAELTPAKCFPPEVANGFVPASDGKVGMVTSDGGKTWAEPVAPPMPARSATSYDLVSVLSDDEVTALGKAKAKDQHLFGKRDGAWPEDNPKIARFSTALGTTPKAWFDRVFAPAS